MRLACRFRLVMIGLVLLAPSCTLDPGPAQDQDRRQIKPKQSRFLRLQPPSVKLAEGASISMAAILSEPAPPEGLVVTLQASDTQMITIPATVTFAPGATTAVFTLATHEDLNLTDETVSISAASRKWLPAGATVAIIDHNDFRVEPAASTIPEGTSATLFVLLRKPAPAGGLTLALTSGDTKAMSVPGMVTVAAGATVAMFKAVAAEDVNVDHETVPISVHVYGLGTTSVTAATVDNDLPWIAKRSPNFGDVGSLVTLDGRFTEREGMVTVGGTPASIHYWSATAVTVEVMPGTLPGLQNLVLTDALGRTTNGLPITIRGNDVWFGSDVPDLRSETQAVWTGNEMIVWGGISAYSNVNTGGRYNPSTDSWVSTTRINAPEERSKHTAVWTGTEFIVWGGRTSKNGSTLDQNTGGRYNPNTDSWMSTSTLGAPTGRGAHSAIWSGSAMIIWAGYQVSEAYPQSTGGRYDPLSDTWLGTSAVGAPQARSSHTAVWGGNEMIVWGGKDSYYNALGAGGRYDPQTDSWLNSSTDGGPAPRYDHTAVWTGEEMAVWGGKNNSGVYFQTGGRYSPSTDRWLSTNTANSPAARSGHVAVWTGDQMIVWGGNGNTGGLYNPSNDSWTSTPTNAAPSGSNSTAVWTGTKMIVWGAASSAGGQYDPAANVWNSVAMTSSPAARYGHTGVWTGTEMVIWGGYNAGFLNTGSRYDPSMDRWLSVSAVSAPTNRYFHSALWSGTEMIVWGGYNGSPIGSGGRYSPATDSWIGTSMTGSPAGRYAHSIVWTGTEMIVWGGSGTLNTGGRYKPSSDSWMSMPVTGAPAGRVSHTAVWTGEEMIVWGGSIVGGITNSGGRYDPANDNWTTVSTTGAPTARSSHTAVWSGRRMIVWGGSDGTFLNTGSMYYPSADSWAGTSTLRAPAGRYLHSAIWSGAAMVVWGGMRDKVVHTGGRYDPLTDRWLYITATGSPAGRYMHSAIWTGTEMIIWGGYDGKALQGLGRYFP